MRNVCLVGAFLADCRDAQLHDICKHAFNLANQSQKELARACFEHYLRGCRSVPTQVAFSEFLYTFYSENDARDNLSGHYETLKADADREEMCLLDNQLARLERACGNQGSARVHQQKAIHFDLQTSEGEGLGPFTILGQATQYSREGDRKASRYLLRSLIDHQDELGMEARLRLAETYLLDQEFSAVQAVLDASTFHEIDQARFSVLRSLLLCEAHIFYDEFEIAEHELQKSQILTLRDASCLNLYAEVERQQAKLKRIMQVACQDPLLN